MTAPADEWLWGWDPTPGIVSVWAEPDGRALVWRRVPRAGAPAGPLGSAAPPGPDAPPAPLALVREEARFRPWVLLASLDDLAHLGPRLQRERAGEAAPAPGRAARDLVTFTELDGPGALRFVVRADDGRALARAILDGARRRTGRAAGHLRELGDDHVLALPPEEQYLVATGRTYFRDLAYDDVRRAQVDLETTGLDTGGDDRIFLAALRGPDGAVELIEAAGPLTDAAEADLIRRLVARLGALDPDVIENHNLHGFDLPTLAARARRLGVPLALGRAGPPGLRTRPAARGVATGPAAGDDPDEAPRRVRFTVPGRELIDSMDAVRRHDFAARDLPGHGLKQVARHLGVAAADRVELPGAHVHATYQRDPARVRAYAAADVVEAAAIGRVLGGAAFALARMAPRRYERLADAGPATGVLEPLLVRAYLRAGAALPGHAPGDGTPHAGAALHLFATGVAHRIVNADVASLYPSLMRAFRIGPARDRLGVLLALVDRLVEQRLAAKARAAAAPPDAPARHTDLALSAAMKLIVNSAYGYLAAGALVRFSDVHAANEVTRRGRETLGLICRELAARGLQLLEADTDGVYASAPAGWSADDERRVVAEVAALLPPMVRLELGGRYAAMLSHEPKNYALAPYGDGPLILRGVAFRSRRLERFGVAFLRRGLAALLAGDVRGVQDAYVAAVQALRARRVATADVAQRVRLVRSPDEYQATRAARRELPYEAMLGAGRTRWHVGERVHVYRAAGGRAALLPDDPAAAPDREPADATAEAAAAAAPRDYDVDYYVRLLRDTFAVRFARALTPEDYAAVFGDPDQPSLFAPPLAAARPILTVLAAP